MNEQTLLELVRPKICEKILKAWLNVIHAKVPVLLARME